MFGLCSSLNHELVISCRGPVQNGNEEHTYLKLLRVAIDVGLVSFWVSIYVEDTRRACVFDDIFFCFCCHLGMYTMQGFLVYG